jgi:hypothetical protein
MSEFGGSEIRPPRDGREELGSPQFPTPQQPIGEIMTPAGIAAVQGMKPPVDNQVEPISSEDASNGQSKDSTAALPSPKSPVFKFRPITPRAMAAIQGIDDNPLNPNK